MSAPKMWADIPCHCATSKQEFGCRFIYELDDPAALRMEINIGMHTVLWTFERTLLLYGIHSLQSMPTGEGDVQVWTDFDTGPETHIRLRSPNGECELVLDWQVVCKFAAAVHARMPAWKCQQAVSAALESYLSFLKEKQS